MERTDFWGTLLNVGKTVLRVIGDVLLAVAFWLGFAIWLWVMA